MANIRIKDLPADSAPKADDKVPIDLGTTRNTTVEEFVFAGRPTATKTEAEAGTDNKKAMTPLAVKQAIDAQTGTRYVPVTRRVDSGAGLSGGQELTGDVTLSLNSASVASLAKADSAVQSVNGKSGNSVTITPADVGAAPSSIVADVNANTAERHSHTNKSILDATTASFLAAEKTKLSGIESGAQVNTVTSVAGKTGAITLSAADAGAAPDTLVPDINANTTARHTHSNKAILDATTASFLAAEKTKLAGIAAGAQVNTVTSVAGKTGAVSLVKADVGLGNVDNTSDLNKPISTATQGALDGKYNNPAGTTSQYIRGDGSLSTFPSIPQGTVTSVGLTVPTGLSSSGSPVTSSGTIAVSYAAGYQGYTSAEASKLSGIASGAQVNTVNSVNTKTGAVVLNAADVGAAPDTLVADINANTSARHTHSNKAILDATTSSFLAADKTKLTGIEAGAQVNTVTSVAGKTGAVALVKGDVGLGNVDNTSDASKPVSTATQTALNAKANSSVTVSSGTGLTGGGNLTANRSIALNAASIASLGKADTAIQAPGGTTGQILAKNSNTTNDVAWVSSDAATAVSYGPQALTAAQQTQARQNIQADKPYDSIASVAAATVPSFANAIRTNGYYAAGDGGSALYNRVATEPSHAGKVQSADGSWWEISERRLSPRMFGAKGDWDRSTLTGTNNGDFLRNMLAASKALGGLPMVIDGRFAFSGVLSTENTPVSIVGAWFSGAMLICTNDSQGLRVIQDDYWNSTYIEGISILTQVLSTQPALLITYSAADSIGNRNFPRCVVKGVSMYGVDILNHGWNGGLLATNVHNATYDEITVNGRRNQSLPQTNPLHWASMSYGIRIVSSNGFTAVPSDILINNPKIYGADKGIEITGECEGVRIENYILVGVKYGVWGEMTSLRPWIQVMSGHINYLTRGIRLNTSPQSNIDGALLYKFQFSTEDSYAIELDNCNHSQIDNVRIYNLCDDATVSKSNNGIAINNSTACIVGSVIINKPTRAIQLTGTTSACRIATPLLDGVYLNSYERAAIHDTSTLGNNEYGGVISGVSNPSAVSMGTSVTSIVSISSLALSKGDRVRVSVLLNGNRVSGGTVYAQISASASGGGVGFFGHNADVAENRIFGANGDWNMAFSSVFTCTTSGSFSLGLQGVSVSSASTIAAKGAQLVIERL